MLQKKIKGKHLLSHRVQYVNELMQKGSFVLPACLPAGGRTGGLEQERKI